MTKPRQLTQLVIDGTEQYRKQYGHDWKYAGGIVARHGKSYYLWVGATPYHLGTAKTAANHLNDYLTSGRPNHAMCRAGAK